jgi:phosphoribosyl 1,2-cyclic phosphodiesterase
MRFACLGSGSEGNGLVVQVGGTCLLLDCGFSVADTIARLARLGLTPTNLTGVVVTHEHSDHIGGVARLSRRYDIPVWLTFGTLHWLADEVMSASLHIIDSHAEFSIGDVQVFPFPVPHDAREPVQFVFSDGVHRLGVLTDLGGSTPHVEACLSPVDALVIECNHDRGMLFNGPYPPGLKERVGGRFGHLDNQAAAGLLARIERSRLQHVIAAHLSQQNNTPVLARQALAGALNCSDDWIGIAEQNSGFGWRQIC